MKRIIKINLIAILLIALLSITCYSLGVTPTDFKPVEVAGSEHVEKAGSLIVSYIVYIGVCISVGTLIVLGIKYMLGSAEDRADYKKSMIPYWVGSIMLFIISALMKLIYNFFSTISK